MSSNKQNSVITTDKVLALCQEIYPNLTWEIAIYDPRFTHGKIYGTMPNVYQFLDLTVTIDNSATITLIAGRPNGFNGQSILKRGYTCKLGTVDPLYDLSSYLENFQKLLMNKAHLELIFASRDILALSPHQH